MSLVFVHNMMMVGPPGAGKTLLARSMPSILPRISLDVTRVYSSADQLPSDTDSIRTRPFRGPHHTISSAQGSRPFPANFQLIAAMNPCPCGYHYNDPVKECIFCSSNVVTKYQKRISNPLLDRIDIHIEVPRIVYEKRSDNHLGESSADIRASVETARERQGSRINGGGDGQKSVNVLSNTYMDPTEVRKFCKLDETSEGPMRSAMSQLQLSARAYHRVLKLARTISDLAGEEKITPAHLAEALQYRPKFI